MNIKMKKKKKVLHILNTNSYSGAENVVITIINNMNENYECAYSSMDGPIAKLLEKNSITFFPIRKTKISEVRRIVKIFKPDIIHAHDYTVSIICALAGVRVPIISHLHNNSPWIKNYNLYSIGYLISTIRYKKILGVSQAIFNEYIFAKQIKYKSIVISNPIDINEIMKKSKGDKFESPSFDIIFLGRLSAPKNPLRFIKLVKEITYMLPNLQVAIIGDGDLKDACQVKIKDLELTHNVHILGFQSNPYRILASSKLLCMASEWEGFGLVAVEALSLGVPVVGTPVGGLPDIVDHECGLLTNNDILYVNEVIKLLTEMDYWEEKSKNAIKKSKNLYNLKEYIKVITLTYEEVLI